MLEIFSAFNYIVLYYYRTKWQELIAIAQIMNQTFLENIYVMIQR